MARTTSQTTKAPAAKATGAAKGKAAPAAGAKGAKAAAKAPAPVVAKAGQPKAAPKKDTAPAPVKPAKAPVVTLKHLAAGLADKRGTSKPETTAVALALMEDLVEQVRAGARVKIPGLGAIEIRDRPARMGRNPATGKPVQVAASRKLVFRPAKELKDAV